MTLSDIAAQHRQKEANSLKRFLIYSLAGSIIVHGGLFVLRLNPSDPFTGTPNILQSHSCFYPALAPESDRPLPQAEPVSPPPFDPAPVESPVPASVSEPPTEPISPEASNWEQELNKSVCLTACLLTS